MGAGTTKVESTAAGGGATGGASGAAGVMEGGSIGAGATGGGVVCATAVLSEITKTLIDRYNINFIDGVLVCLAWLA